ncbi:hypothetical protein L226DRAFT_492090 [Lentinus tigrinus ALCF2SS1-7]|uniref:Fungal-type protein kinase domain-containing protein n=1 Tax=Lentinus tigrinus ALCF2SS1-6 TaxID=1328759 RepID=A0A5C2S0J5_9APHY|nr:hypothetical protein L227DRAFT_655967 [Lentinus tigrinus ALCF2SS1-6]RPD71221.1 hypothetical protein L226DRAFT_492090 [Lentinus tigrinus ALCF2SS1-7]
MASKCIGNTKCEFADKYFPRLPPSNSPSSTRSKPSLAVNPFEKLKKANTMSEKRLQDTFIDIVNRHGLAPGLKMGSCETRPDSAKIDPDRQNVHAAFWREDAAPSDNQPHWIDQLMPVEFKAGESGSNYKDPYVDDANVPGGVVVRESILGTKKFGEIISYAELVFTVQHRQAVFMPLVIGRVCRFLRWDHGGAVVTEAIDYYQDWQFFCDVLWRISQCSDELLGVDPTAIRLSDGDEEFKTMDDAAIPNPTDVDATERMVDAPLQGSVTFSYVRKMFGDSLDAQWPRYKLEVPDGKTTRHFLVCRPAFCAKGLIGRGTRGYVALDCGTGRFVWLKDAWRAYYLLLEKEGDVLEELKKAEVPNIPTVVCHGDIREQTTLTSQVWELKNPQPSASGSGSSGSTFDQHRTSSASSSKRKWDDADDSGVHVPPPKGLSEANLPFRDDCPLRPHRHYRLVVEEVAKSLSEFQRGAQLVSVINDCIWAHYVAATNPTAPRLHRDVSGGNILMYPQVVEVHGKYHMKWTGLLADWEMSKPIEEVHGKSRRRQPERTGTWQYMSVALLSRDKTVEICDELEAFLYVLLYHAIRYLRSNLGEYTAANYLDEFFDQYTATDRGYGCGTRKMLAIATGKLMVTEHLELRFDEHMDNLISMLLGWFRANHVVNKYFQELEEEKKQKQKRKQAQAFMAPPLLPDQLPDNPAPAVAHREVVVKRSLVFGNKLSRSLKNYTRQLQVPPQQDWDNMEMVQTHGWMYQALEGFLMDRVWPVDDKVGDRIPKSWVKPPLGSTVQTTTNSGTGSNKRVCYGRMEGVVTLPLPFLQRKPPNSPTKRTDSLSDDFWRR